MRCEQQVAERSVFDDEVFRCAAAIVRFPARASVRNMKIADINRKKITVSLQTNDSRCSAVSVAPGAKQHRLSAK